MSTLALKSTASSQGLLGWGIAASLVALAVVHIGVTMNQALAIMITAIILIIWAHSNANGLITAIIFFLVKPVFLRIAYAVDKETSGSGGADLLGITPALLLAGLIVWHSYMKIASGEKMIVGRTRLLIILFSAIAFLSIFNLANSILVGLGGFERNVLPNMMVLLTASFLITETADLKRLIKVLLVLGVVSCAYGIGQYFSGIYPWEKDWILEIAFKETSSGWLTIGLSGVEFRLFSIFYNYMDFTFCNALIFALAISFGTILKGKWKLIRILFVVLWTIVLLVSLERTPLLMSIAAIAFNFYLSSCKERRKRIIWKTAIIGGFFVASLAVASPYLKATGADKLIRLAELANPFAAGSVEDRLWKNWGPTIETIAENPLGVGIGYGSQTRANTFAAQTEFFVEPHNELLQKILETGVLGGVIFLILLIAVFRDGLRLSRVDAPVKQFGIGFAAVTVGFWLCGMVNVPFSGSSGLLYWALAGVVLSMAEKQQGLELPAAKKKPETADNSSS